MGDRIVRSRGVPFVRSGAKRKSLWLQFAPTEVTIVTTGATLVFSLNAAALATLPFTVVRSRFAVHIRSDQVAAAETQQLGVGLAVVSVQASAVGITAVPTPITDLSSDMFFWIDLLFDDNVVDSSPLTRTKGAYFQVDSKAMRKVGVGQDIVLVMEGAAQNDGLVATVGGRMLVKLH